MVEKYLYISGSNLGRFEPSKIDWQIGRVNVYMWHTGLNVLRNYLQFVPSPALSRGYLTHGCVCKYMYAWGSVHSTSADVLISDQSYMSGSKILSSCENSPATRAPKVNNGSWLVSNSQLILNFRTPSLGPKDEASLSTFLALPSIQ